MSFLNQFFSSKKDDFKQSLAPTKGSLLARLSKIVVGKSTIDDEVLDQLEELLISSDVGIPTTLQIIERVQQRVARDKYVSTDELNSILCAEIAHLLNTDFKFLSEKLTEKILGLPGML